MRGFSATWRPCCGSLQRQRKKFVNDSRSILYCVKVRLLQHKISLAVLGSCTSQTKAYTSLFSWRKKPTLFAERGKRSTGERQTVPPKAQRMVLLDVVLELLDVALNWWRRQGGVRAADRSGWVYISHTHTHTDAEFWHLSGFIWCGGGAQESALGGGPYDRAVQHVLLRLFALFQMLIGWKIKGKVESHVPAETGMNLQHKGAGLTRSCFSLSLSTRYSSHCSSTYCRNFCPFTKNSRPSLLSQASISDFNFFSSLEMKTW